VVECALAVKVNREIGLASLLEHGAEREGQERHFLKILESKASQERLLHVERQISYMETCKKTY